MKDQLDSSAKLLRRGVGNPHSYQGHGRILFQQSSWLTKSVVFDLTARGIRCALIDLSDFERKRIRDGDMAGDLRKDHRVLGSDGIELMAVGKSFIGPEGLIPASAGDPFACFVLRDGDGDALLHFLRGSHARERECELVGTRATEKHVGIIESRHDELALEIDGLDAFLAASAIEENVVRLADASDPSFA